MKMLKPTLAHPLFYLAIAVIVLLTPGTWQSVAAQTINELSIGNVNAAPGDSGSFPIVLNNGSTVTSGEIHLSYDSDVVQLTNARNEERLDGYTVNFSQDTSNPDDVKVKILFYVLGTQSVSPGNGMILNMDYTVPTQASGSTDLEFEIPATTLIGEGSDTPILTVNPINGVFNIVDNNEAEITSIQPNTGDVGTTLDVTISGQNTNFATGQTTVDLGDGINVSSVTVNSATQLIANIEIAADTSAGSRNVTVTTENEIVTKEEGFSVNVNGPDPVITNITPDNGNPGDTLEVTIGGQHADFVDGRTDADFGEGITVNTVSVVQPTQAVVEITIAADAAPGERTVSLTTGSQVATQEQGFRVNVPPSTSGAATLYVDPSPVMVTVGETKMLEIMLAPGTTPINGVQIHGKVDPTYLRLVNVTQGADQLSEVLDSLQFNAASGEFRFGAGVLGTTVSEPFVVLTLEVEALMTTSSSGTPITFLHTSPSTDIAGPSGSVMEAARDGVVTIEGASSTATLSGRVDLQGRPAKPHLSWSIPVTVEMTLEGTSNPTFYLVNTDESGEFELSNLPPGAYQMRIKGGHTIANRVEQVTLAAGSNAIFFGTLYEGDIETDRSGNAVVIADFGPLSGAFDSCVGEAGYRASADLNETDDCVTIEDFGLLSTNFNREGDVTYDSPTRIPAPLPLSSAEAVLEFESSTMVSGADEVIALSLYVDPRGGDGVAGVKGRYRFDPAQLEVTDVLLTGALSTVLIEPDIDNAEGVINFSASAPVGHRVNERAHVATFRVKLKDGVSMAKLTPIVGGARDTNIAGGNGSVMANATGITITSNAIVFDHQILLPVIIR